MWRRSKGLLDKLSYNLYSRTNTEEHTLFWSFGTRKIEIGEGFDSISFLFDGKKVTYLLLKDQMHVRHHTNDYIQPIYTVR